LNKDNLLYTVVGILIGFVSAYLLFEAMAARQPPRLTPELRAQIALPGENPAGGGAGGPTDARVANAGMAEAAAGGGPAVEEVQQLSAYVQQNPDDADAVLRLANLNFDIRNWGRAQELYNRYLKLRPGNPDVLTDLGISYRETQQFDSALERFRQARKMAPGHWQSYYNEVVVLAFDLKRYAEADPLLQELQRMQPANQEVAKLAEAVARQRS
jgi:tetratricopeptide (TPR) repeat protein